jgi:hypothetical protein
MRRDFVARAWKREGASRLITATVAISEARLYCASQERAAMAA